MRKKVTKGYKRLQRMEKFRRFGFAHHDSFELKGKRLTKLDNSLQQLKQIEIEEGEDCTIGKLFFCKINYNYF